jgi:hypothetical protein
MHSLTRVPIPSSPSRICTIRPVRPASLSPPCPSLHPNLGTDYWTPSHAASPPTEEVAQPAPRTLPLRSAADNLPSDPDRLSFPRPPAVPSGEGRSTSAAAARSGHTREAAWSTCRSRSGEGGMSHILRERGRRSAGRRGIVGRGRRATVFLLDSPIGKGKGCEDGKGEGGKHYPMIC